MKLDDIISIILSALMVISPILSAVLIAINLKLKKRMDELKTKIDEMGAFISKKTDESDEKLQNELSKQRRMLTETISGINDNLTRGVISLSKKGENK